MRRRSVQVYFILKAAGRSYGTRVTASNGRTVIGFKRGHTALLVRVLHGFAFVSKRSLVFAPRVEGVVTYKIKTS